MFYEVDPYGVPPSYGDCFWWCGTVLLKLTVCKAVNNELLWTFLLCAVNFNEVWTSTFNV
jgi:hypothetical protein